MDTIAQKIRRACAANGPRIAVHDGETALAFADLDAAAAAGARALRAHALREGEPVVIPVSGRAADLVAFLAVWRAGGVAAPVHRSVPPAVAEALRARTQELLSTKGFAEYFDPLTGAPAGGGGASASPATALDAP